MQSVIFFFFNDTATTEIYTLSLHDALPIYGADGGGRSGRCQVDPGADRPHVEHFIAHAGNLPADEQLLADRKSTRLNSSHTVISYAVFCLKKKKTDDTLS